MPFLKQAIREQKLLEAEVDIESFISSNGITDEMVIYLMSFDKEAYQDEKEVKEYLNDKYYSNDNIVDGGDVFNALVTSTMQLDLDSRVEIEIRRGVTAYAAELRALPTEAVNFNELPTFNLSNKDVEIMLTEGLPHIIEIARVAEGYHANYGQIKITSNDLESMERNFKNKVTGVDLAINEDHKKNEAFAWFKDVFRSFDGQTLYAQVNWNAKGTRALSEKEYRYFSPEFKFSYTHPHTGAEHGATLLGGALTNYPFLKMDAITQLNQKEERGMKVDTKTISLSEHQTQVIELNGKIREFEKGEETFKKTITSLKEENVELNDKVTTLEKEKVETEKKAQNEKLFTENKINKAQLVALNEGKDLIEVLALGKVMNTDGKGSSEVKNDDVELSDKEKELAAKMDLTHEEFVKYNKGGF